MTQIDAKNANVEFRQFSRILVFVGGTFRQLDGPKAPDDLASKAVSP